jgi:hypothetical protein
MKRMRAWYGGTGISARSVLRFAAAAVSWSHVCVGSSKKLLHVDDFGDLAIHLEGALHMFPVRR